MTEYEYLLSQTQTPSASAEPLLPTTTPETPQFTVQDADTVNNARLLGYDAPETFLDSKKSGKLVDLGINPEVMQGMGLKAKEKFMSLMGPDVELTKEGVGYYGRDLVRNDDIANLMIAEQLGVPTDRYDAKKQDLYRRAQEKQKALLGTNTEEMETLRILREYNIDREAPGVIERAGDTIDALQSGAVQAAGKLTDFVTDVVGYGADKVGAEKLGKWFDEAGEKMASTEFADRVTGFDRRESQFAMAEATHQWEMGDYTGALLTAVKTPEVLAESIPLMVEMVVGAGKVKALAKVPGFIKNNLGLAAVIGQETNAQAEDFEAEFGEKVSAAKLAEMTAINTVMFSLDRISFKALLKGKDALTATAKALPEASKKEIMIRGLGIVGATGKAMGQEAAQEYAQTWGEILNVSDTDMQGYIAQLSDEEKQREALTGGIFGAAGGAQIKAAGAAYHAVTKAPTAAKKVKEAVDKKVEDINVEATREDIISGMEEIKDIPTDELNADQVHTKVQYREEQFKEALKNGDTAAAQEALLAIVGPGLSKLEELGHAGVEQLRERISEHAKALDEHTRQMEGTTEEKADSILGSMKVGALSFKEPEAILKDLEGKELTTEEQALVDEYAQNAAIVGDATVEFEKTIEANKGKDTLEVEKEVLDGPKGINTYVQQIVALTKNNDLEGARKAHDNLQYFISSQMEKVAKLKKAVEEMKAIDADPDAMNDSVTVDYGKHADGRTARFKVEMKRNKDSGTTADKLINRIEASITYGSEMITEFAPTKTTETVAEPVSTKEPIMDKGEAQDDKAVQETTSTQETATKPKSIKESIEAGAILNFSKQVTEQTASKLEALGYKQEEGTNRWLPPVQKANYSQLILDTDPLATIEEIVIAKDTDNVIMSEDFDTLDFPDFMASVDEAMSGKAGSFLDRLDAKDGKRFSSMAKKVLFTTEGADKRVVATIVKVAEDFIITQGMKLAYNSPSDMESMLELPEGALTDAQATILQDAGQFKHVIANSLGGQLIQELGLGKFKDTKEADLEKLKSELGQMVLIYMESMGDIEPLTESRIDEENQKILYNNPEAKHGISMVKLSQTAYDMLTGEQSRADVKAYYEQLKEKLNGMDGFVKYETYEKPRKQKFKVKGTKISTASQEATDALNKLQKQEWEFNNVEYEMLLDMDRDVLLEYMGYTPEEILETLPYQDRMSKTAKNREIESSIQSLEDMQDRLSANEKTGFFYNWFFSKNGRFFLDSNGVNPQTDKLHRFMVGLKSNTVEIDMANEEHMNNFYIGLAQAFGYDIDKESTKSSIAFGKKVSKMDNVAAVLEKGYKGPLGSHDIGHTIQGINAVKAYKEAKDGKFTTNLTVETDAVTSGIILKLMQLPNNPKVEMLLAKGGVVSSNLDMYEDFEGTNDLLGGGLLTDMYKTMALMVSRKKTSAKKMLDKTKNNTIKKLKLQIFNDLGKVMPEFLDKEGMVTKDARNLFKPVVMVFGYGANMKNIKKAFANNIIDSLPQRILDGDKDALNLLLSGAGDAFSGMSPKKFKQLIKDKDILEMKYSYIDYTGRTVTGRKTIRETISAVIEETYGADLETSLNALFPGMTDMNGKINAVFKVMFEKFEEAYNKEVAKYGEDMTIEQEQAIFEKLIKKFPGLRAPLQAAKEKMEVIDSERVPGQSSTRTYVNPDIYGQKSLSVNTMMQRLKAAVAAGVVVPIHNIDGSIQTRVLNKVDALGIHDANMFNMHNATEGTMAYNEESFNLSKEYNWLDEINNALRAAKLGDLNEDQQQAMDEFFDMLTEVNAAKVKLFNADFKVDHATGMGAVYEAKVAEDVLLSQEAELNLENFEKQVDTKINNDPEAMNELMGFVVELDLTPENETHMKHLKGVLNKFVSTSGKFLKDMDVYLSTKEEQNVGAINLDEQEMYLGVGKGGLTSDKSMAEVYVHEVVHAATAYARRTGGKLVGSDLARLNSLYLKAAKVLTIADFEDFTVSDKAAEFERAKQQYDYIFANKDGNGIDEFIAHGLTNPKVIEALQKIEVYDAKNKKTSNWFEYLVNLVQSLFEAVYSRALKEKGIKADKLLMKLSLNLASANNTATQRAKRGMVDKMWEKLDVVNKPVLKMVSHIEDYLAKGDVKPIERDADGKMSRWSMIKWIGANIKKIMAGDEQVRKNAMWIFGRMGLSPRGAIAQLLRVYNEKDSLARNMERLLLQANNVDNQKTHDEQAIISALHDSVQTELSEDDKRVLGSYIIEGDMAAIFDDYTEVELENFYRSNEAVRAEIKRLEATLTGNTTFYKAQAKGLGMFMATGATKVNNQLMNAHNINNKLGTPDMFKDVDPANEKTIDQLATLHAILNQSPEGKAMMADLINREYAKDSENNVIISTNKLLQLFKEQSEDKLFDEETGKTASNRVKGYSKELVDNDVAVEIVDIREKADMEAKGYKLVRALAKDEHDTSTGTLAIFRSEDDGLARYQRGSLHITNKRHKGSTMFSTSAEEANISGKKVDLKKLNQGIIKKKAANAKLFQKGSHEATTKQLVPILDREGYIVEYRYMMSKHDRVKLLGKDTSYDKMLGRMYSSMTDKTLSEDMNQLIIDNMVEDSADNKYADDYVFIGKDSPKQEHRDMWKLLPESLQMYIEKETGEKGIAVRKDLQDMVFGYRKGSITDFKFFENKLLMKRAIQVAEKSLAYIASNYKLDIVIKTPAVFIGNVVSNTALLMLNGVGPIQAVTMQLEGARFLDEFKSAQKTHGKLSYEVDAGLLKGKELLKAKKELIRLEEVMNNSPIKDMVDSGLFQAVVEDLTTDEESEFTNKYGKAIENVASKAPSWMKTGAQYAYMTKSTPMYQQMLKATQYSDFVARYVLLATKKQKLMSEGMTEKEASNQAMNLAIDSFINYEIPDSKLVQYLNDHGFLMFTKYFMGIQNVLKNLTQKNPVYAMAMVLGVNAVYDIEDVYEQSVFVKDVGSMVHGPFEGLGELWKPSSLQAIDKYIV